MIIQNFTFREIEYLSEYVENDMAWKGIALQLSAGPLFYSSKIVDLPGVQLRWYQIGNDLLIREFYEGPQLVFGFSIGGEQPPIYRSQELDYGQAVIWRDVTEHSYVVPKATKSLVIHVDPEIVQLLGWTLAGVNTGYVALPTFQRLIETCRLASLAAAHVSDECTPTSENTIFIWRDRVLVALEQALEYWLHPPSIERRTFTLSARHFKLFKDAVLEYETVDIAESASIDDLAKELGVHRRTLFKAFRETIGIGPHRYLQICRMHRLRSQLLRADPSNVTVTRLAYEFGFKHMGRMASDYKMLFSESPSETLKR